MLKVEVNRIWKDTVEWAEKKRAPPPFEEVVQAFARQIEQETTKRVKKALR